MLSTLVIKDFAIIERLEIEFADGMTVLTGETGAGKSIVINALNLILGGRASADLIRTGVDTAVVEGAFELALDSPQGERLRGQLGDLAIEFDGTLVVRRIVSRNGRNKVLVNGSLATLATLRELTSGLIDISGQHEHYSLLDVAEHRILLDRFGNLEADVAAIHADFAELRAVERAATALRDEARDRLARIDYLRFQLNELQNAELVSGERERLQDERDRLSNVEKIRTATHTALHNLYEDEGSVSARLDSAIRGLERLEGTVLALSPVIERLSEARAIVDDATYDLRSLAAVDDDPRRLDAIHERLDRIDRLERKFGLHGDDLIAEIDEIERELERLQSAESKIGELEAIAAELADALLDTARQVSAKRRALGRELEGQIESELATLGMPGSAFRVAITTSDDPRELKAWGIDRVEFLLAPNPGESHKALAKIASGGELSRAMLAIKRVLASNDHVATYVFDEVDAGIGGAVAVQVGRALHRVSHQHQVLCITHLASIASHAEHHFKVMKTLEEDRTRSRIERLNEDAKIREIARMLGGEATERSLDHAAEMVERARTEAVSNVPNLGGA